MRSTQYMYWAHQLTLSEKGEVEELVRLSFQALERNLENRSKIVIKERGWGEAVDVMNRRGPRMRPNEHWTAPQYPPQRPGSMDQNMPSYGGYFGDRPYPGHGETFPDESRQARASLPGAHTRGEPPAMRHERPMTAPPPNSYKLIEQDAPKSTRHEVRFTFPREQLVSDLVGSANEASSTSAKPDTSSTTDNRLHIVRQKLERLRKRKEKAEKDGDSITAADLIYYSIPEVEADLEKLLKQRREELEKSAAPVSQNEEDKSHQVEVETESEGSDNEGGSEALDLYD